MKYVPLPLRALAAVLVLASAAHALPAWDGSPSRPPSVDPLAGKWTGTIRHRDDSVAFGLEFSRNEKGELIAAQTLPATHIARYALGPVTVDGPHCTGSGLDLTLRGERLEGTYGSLPLAISVRRSDRLPVPHPALEIPPPPSPAWRYLVKSAFWATPALFGDRVYVGSADGVMHAVAIADGKVAWTTPTGGAIYGEALVTAENVYVFNDAGRLLALTRADGRERWHADLGGSDVPRELPADAPPYAFDYQAPSPVLADGVLYLASADGICHALDATTGKPLWQHSVGGKIRTSALVLDDRIILASLDQFVSALDRKTGTPLWRIDSGGPVTTSPVFAGGHILVGTRSYMLVALHPADGSRAWERFQWFSWVESTPLLAGSSLYIGSSDNRAVRALNPADGRTLWSTDLNGWAWARPAVSTDLVFANCAGPAEYPLKPAPTGSLSALDRRTGAMKWRHPARPIPGSYLHGFVGAPAVAGNRVIVAGLDGTLIAFPIDLANG